jgi:hypothetical protein
MGHSSRETGSLFRVAPATVARWEGDHLADPKKKTVGKLVRPNPPTRRYADVVRRVVQTMGLIGFGGNAMIANILARACWKLGPTTVRNYRKEPMPLPVAAPLRIPPAAHGAPQHYVIDKTLSRIDSPERRLGAKTYRCFESCFGREGVTESTRRESVHHSRRRVRIESACLKEMPPRFDGASEILPAKRALRGGFHALMSLFVRFIWLYRSLT